MDLKFGELQERLRNFASARELYRKRDWEQAQHAFQDILDRTPDDGPSRMYWKPLPRVPVRRAACRMGRCLHDDAQVATARRRLALRETSLLLLPG